MRINVTIGMNKYPFSGKVRKLEKTHNKLLVFDVVSLEGKKISAVYIEKDHEPDMYEGSSVTIISHDELKFDP